ncbi:MULTISPECIES: Sir2 family NAD-dependent protein deacetylase [unclassified Duganella]|uniref:SIR2 family NAD-dependent protein deacylase n=1 Tax=unclassified Duganella TaxID=2636909 RepID=UPI0006F50A9B|nr:MULTISPECIES: Sir2 family NAD-dependent protein deacetylase [unclassified Duganella]KQV54474.1 NAD-dependent deacetylase [Duganella sp. Root336D2]KRC03600.1 NAD-dependent deacetylase [Duganella sp. Root198D2]
MTIEPQLAARAAELIAQSDGLAIAAGAGIGVDSGLPDFRGNEGFWKAYPALGRARMEFTSVASPRTFQDDPALAWGFYGHRLNLYRETVPHAGFTLLKGWGETMEHGSFVFTSNVDGQFQKAGFDPQAVYECHGSIHHLQCLGACGSKIWAADDFGPEVDADACRLRNEAPRCPDCGGLARPNILMFGDWGWIERRSEMQAARLEAWLEKVRRPLVIELGAGTAIPSVRHFGHGVVQRGGRMVRINPREFAVGSAQDVGVAAGALEGLLAIAAAINQNR